MRQHAHIIRQAQFFQLAQPHGGARQKTHPQTRHAQLGKSAHHQQILVVRQLRDETIRGKSVIRLVQHHQPWRSRDDLPDGRRVEQITGRIVRIGEENKSGLVTLDG